MSIPPEIMALIQAAQGISGKPGSQLTGSDVSRLFQPDLGVLTGTYTDRPEVEESDEDIRARTSPYLNQIRNNPEADVVAAGIAADIENGIPLIQMKKNLRTYFTTQKISPNKKKQTDEEKQTILDYTDLLDTLSKEYNTYTSEITKIKNKAPKKTFFSEAGLPEPDAPYDPEPFMGGIYAKLAEQAAPRQPGPTKTLPMQTYDIPNERRAKEAVASSENIKSMIARNMQQRGAGSPLLDAIQQRLMLTKVVENSGSKNKLKA